MKIEAATVEPSLTILKELFREYQNSLGIDLCFQNFEQELASLPGKYQLPAGRLYLASQNDKPAGCIALRPLADGQGEMKRLYVRPEYRKLGLGRQLAETIIKDAREIGYRQILLDTLSSMNSAVRLYTDLGFYDIPPYCFNPSEDVRYLCLDL